MTSRNEYHTETQRTECNTVTPKPTVQPERHHHINKQLHINSTVNNNNGKVKWQSVNIVPKVTEE